MAGPGRGMYPGDFGCGLRECMGKHVADSVLKDKRPSREVLPR